jgi:hypothetical protein
MAGPEDEMYEPFERLEQETIEAIEQLEATETAYPEEESGAPDEGFRWRHRR